MAIHKPSSIWPTRPLGVYPQQYVRTLDEDHIGVSFHATLNGLGREVRLTRHEARMLARRLNECLDDTRSPVRPAKKKSRKPVSEGLHT